MNTKKRVTIKDVAAAAGVTPSTVSFVLNKTKGQTISRATRERVLSCAAELGYRAHYQASAIRTGTSRTIGVVTAYKINHLYFLDFIQGVLIAAQSAGYGVMICPNQAADHSASFIQYYQERRIDGVVFISSAHSEEKSYEEAFISLFQRHTIPFVVIYGYTRLPGVSYINTNLHQDGFTATRSLIAKGCRRVGYIGALDKDNCSRYTPGTEADRLRGYMDALDSESITPWVLFFPRDFHAIDYEALLSTLRDKDCDGYVVCWATYGLQLLSALDAIHGGSSEVPIVALDSLPYLNHIRPQFTALRLPFREMALKGTEALLEHLENPDAPVVDISLTSGMADEARST